MPTKLSGAPVLRWRNRNITGILDISGTNIYRSTTPMDINAMPTPYDTVTGHREYYADINVTYGETYYYRIGVFDDKEEKITDGEVSFTVGDDTLQEPFDLEATFYENDDSGAVQEPFSIEASFDQYLTD